jgi:hypothetical protein
VTRTYAGFFYLPAFRLQMDWPRVLLCFLLNIAVGQAATFISSGFVTRVSPAEAMSRPIPPAGGAPGFLGRLTRRVSPMTAFSLTTLLRNPVRFAFSVLCVSASIMMIFAALAFLTSKDNLIRQTYEQRIRYDCSFRHVQQGCLGYTNHIVIAETGFAHLLQPIKVAFPVRETAAADNHRMDTGKIHQ